MILTVERFNDNKESTLGYLKVDDDFECFTLEDTFREKKIAGQTRIPKGKYRIKLRKEGGMNRKYSSRYSSHEGMLWLQNVKNFSWVYIHIGNNSKDTEGCILVGEGCMSTPVKQTLVKSRIAYLSLYEKIIKKINEGTNVFIEIKDNQ